MMEKQSELGLEMLQCFHRYDARRTARHRSQDPSPEPDPAAVGRQTTESLQEARGSIVNGSDDDTAGSQERD